MHVHILIVYIFVCLKMYRFVAGFQLVVIYNDQLSVVLFCWKIVYFFLIFFFIVKNNLFQEKEIERVREKHEFLNISKSNVFFTCLVQRFSTCHLIASVINRQTRISVGFYFSCMSLRTQDNIRNFVDTQSQKGLLHLVWQTTH